MTNWDERLNIARCDYLEQENKILRVKLKEERRNFDLLERAVDRSKDSLSIFLNYHKHRQRE